MRTVLGLGELAATGRAEVELKTFALGSCIGLVLYDSKSEVVGMAHVVMPDSTISPAKAEREPGRFADTAVPALIAEMKTKGSAHKLVAKLVGGALISEVNANYEIGKRNTLAVKKLLWKYRIPALAEELGGSICRTISTKINGKVRVSTPDMEDRVL